MTWFLVDQQPPKGAGDVPVRSWLRRRAHIKEYEGGTTTPDPEIAALADSEDRFVVTKDDDFRITHLLGKPPAQLLHVTCGNMEQGSKGGVILFRGSGAAACRYSDSDRSRADYYYLKGGATLAAFTVTDGTGEVVATAQLDAEA